MNDQAKCEKKLRQLRHVVSDSVAWLDAISRRFSGSKAIEDALANVKKNLKIALDETEP